jgi:hypothetical protein
MFASARRAQRFLEFVVEQTLAAQQDYIKESVIGSEVFGREAGYDPRADGIVRVEATTVHFPFGDVHWNIVISDNGKKILAILKDPGFVFSADTKQYCATIRERSRSVPVDHPAFATPRVRRCSGADRDFKQLRSSIRGVR